MSAELILSNILKIIDTDNTIKLQQYIVSLNIKKEEITKIINSYYNGGPLAEYICYYNKPNVLKLLANYGLCMNRNDSAGYNLLHIACYRDENNIIKALIELGFDVNISVHSGKTCMYIIYIDNYDGYKLLIENGANINKKYKYTVYLTHYNDVCVDINSVLSYIIYHGNVNRNMYNIVKLMIEYGADVNV